MIEELMQIPTDMVALILTAAFVIVLAIDFVKAKFHKDEAVKYRKMWHDAASLANDQEAHVLRLTNKLDILGKRASTLETQARNGRDEFARRYSQWQQERDETKEIVNQGRQFMSDVGAHLDETIKNCGGTPPDIPTVPSRLAKITCLVTEAWTGREMAEQSLTEVSNGALYAHRALGRVLGLESESDIPVEEDEKGVPVPVVVRNPQPGIELGKVPNPDGDGYTETIGVDLANGSVIEKHLKRVRRNAFGGGRFAGSEEL